MRWRIVCMNWRKFLQQHFNVTGIERERTWYNLCKHNEKMIMCLKEFAKIDCKCMYCGFINKKMDTLSGLVWFHDIGKLISKENHEEISYQMLKNNVAFDYVFVEKEEKKLLLKIIREHLTLGNVFTGEWDLGQLYRNIAGLKESEVHTYLRYLLILSVIDMWSYCDDIEYVRNVFMNYQVILQRVMTRKYEHEKQYNAIWRIICLIGLYKKLNYNDQDIVIETYDRLSVKCQIIYYVTKICFLIFFIGLI